MANDSELPHAATPNPRQNDTPKFKHDCNECMYVMHLYAHDIYMCRAHAMPTLIARRSDSPEDYRAVMMELVIKPWVRIGV
jgi:hypothetical protein